MKLSKWYSNVLVVLNKFILIHGVKVCKKSFLDCSLLKNFAIMHERYSRQWVPLPGHITGSCDVLNYVIILPTCHVRLKLNEPIV